MVLVSCLGDTERLGADRGQPRVSPQQIRPAQGRRPGRPLTGSPAPGLAAGGAPARREAGTGRTTRRAGLQGEHAAAVRRPASSLVWAGAWASATTTWLGYPPKGHGRRQRRGCARRVSPGRVSPGAARGRGNPGRRPRIPHPAQAAHPRGHRPRAEAPGLEGGRRMRRYWVPAPPPQRSGR